MNDNAACPIWETPATEFLSHGRDGREVDSPRAGGRYFITGSAEAILRNRDKTVKARLTTWLIDQRRLGIVCPEIDTDTIKEAEARRQLPIRERADRFLRYLANREPFPGSGFPALSHEVGLNWFLLALSSLESAVSPSNVEQQKREISFF